MYESANEQSKRDFYYHESSNNKNNNIENDDSITLFWYVDMLFINPYNKPVINLATWSLREIIIWRRLHPLI